MTIKLLKMIAKTNIYYPFVHLADKKNKKMCAINFDIPKRAKKKGSFHTPLIFTQSNCTEIMGLRC